MRKILLVFKLTPFPHPHVCVNCTHQSQHNANCCLCSPRVAWFNLKTNTTFFSAAMTSNLETFYSISFEFVLDSYPHFCQMEKACVTLAPTNMLFQVSRLLADF